jgi:Ricin-type beta-trefoil lectin domain
MPNHRLVTLLSAVAIATTAGLAVASPARAADVWPINSRWSNMCLQPANGSTEQGAAIVQQPCGTEGKAGTPPPVQNWTLIPVSGNIFHLQNSLNTQLCLDARGGAVDRTPVQQWPCNWISNENWEWGPTDSHGDRQLISRVSGTRTHCLDIPGAQIMEGLEMWIYHCTKNNVAQQWWYGPGVNPD